MPVEAVNQCLHTHTRSTHTRAAHEAASPACCTAASSPQPDQTRDSQIHNPLRWPLSCWAVPAAHRLMEYVEGLTWMEGLLSAPRFDVVWRGSWPNIMVCRMRHRAAQQAKSQGVHHECASLANTLNSPPAKQPDSQSGRQTAAEDAYAATTKVHLPAPSRLLPSARAVGSPHTCGLMSLNASMTTLPFTLCTGSTTTATARWFRASKDCAGTGTGTTRSEQLCVLTHLWACTKLSRHPGMPHKRGMLADLQGSASHAGSQHHKQLRRSVSCCCFGAGTCWAAVALRLTSLHPCCGCAHLLCVDVHA